MLHFQSAALDPRDFWNVAPVAFGAATGTDLFIGRNTFSILAAAGLEEIAVNYIVVDTVRVPRETFAAIIEAWRDGYAEPIGQFTPITRESAVAYFDQMIANIRDPKGYAVWMVPVVSARVPAAGQGRQPSRPRSGPCCMPGPNAMRQSRSSALQSCAPQFSRDSTQTNQRGRLQ